MYKYLKKQMLDIKVVIEKSVDKNSSAFLTRFK